jgi:hypothetical protein
MSIEHELLETALSEIQSQNLQITSGCRDYLEGFIKQGATNFAGVSDLEAAQADLGSAEARENLIRFVNQMIGYAISQGVTELHEDSFWNVRNRVCPLFPFC